MSIADNLHRVRERIARAAESAGRSADEITLVGVTKYVGAPEAAELVAAGCLDLGESRPQELWKKHDELSEPRAFPRPPRSAGTSSATSNATKSRRTLPLVSLIHSVDSERLLAAINEAQRRQPVTSCRPSTYY